MTEVRPDDVDAPDVVDPSTIINPPPEPLLTRRRVAITLIVVAALALLVWGYSHGGDDPTVAARGREVVVRYDPAPGGRVLRQAEIGVELEPGYDGRLAINGIAIPEEQMTGAILPGSEAFEQLSPEERARGPRPNNRHVVRFQPGEGKVIERFTTGEVKVTVTAWRVADGPGSARRFTYTIYVT